MKNGRHHALATTLALVVFSAILFLGGCSAATPAAPTSLPREAEKTAYSWKMAGMSAPGQYITLGEQKLISLVQERTGGRMKIEHYPAGQLYPSFEIGANVQRGIIELGSVPPGHMADVMPEGQWDGAPFMISSIAGQRKLLDAGVRDILKPMFQKRGFVLLGHSTWGPTLLWSRAPVEKSADFKGLKIRTYSPASLEVTNALGATGTTITAAEQYLALQRGVVDAAWCSLSWGRSNNLSEVTKYLVDVSYNVAVHFYIVNKAAFEALPSDIQNVILQAGLEAESYSLGLGEKAAGDDYNFLADKIKVTKIAPEELERWRAAVQPQVDKFLADMGPDMARIVDVLRRVK